MSQKTIKIIGWVLTGLLAFVFIGSAFGKLSGSTSTLQMATSWGINASQLKIIGAVELLSIILFAIPRTGILGTLLLVAYMGGAIATHLEHQLNILPPIAVSAFVWITAIVRFSELSERILD